jgi:hypothetical protein
MRERQDGFLRQIRRKKLSRLVPINPETWPETGIDSLDSIDGMEYFVS